MIFFLVGIILVGIALSIYLSSSVQHSIVNYYFGTDKKILELSRVKDFEIGPHTGAPLMTISGLIMDSALVAGKLYRSEENNVISLRLSLALTDGKSSGRFQFEIPQPRDEERIVFGNEKVEVWPRRQLSNRNDSAVTTKLDFKKPMVLDEEPILGGIFHPPAQSTNMTLAGSAQSYPSYLVSFHDVVFEIGVENNTILYISVNDKNFVSPEGLRIGNSLADALKIAQAKMSHEAGWAYYVHLKSGWNAGLAENNPNTGHLAPNAKIVWFFRRK